MRNTLRFALAASSAVLTLAGVAAPAAHAVAPTAAFDFGKPGNLVAPSVGLATATGQGGTSPATAVIPGVAGGARPVASVPAGAGRVLFPTNEAAGATSWAIQATFQVATVATGQSRHLLQVSSSGSALDLADTGGLVWYDADASASVALSNLPTVGDGDWLNVVISSDGVDLTVYANNLTQTLQASGTANLAGRGTGLAASVDFLTPTDGDSAGQIARFRVFDGPIGDPTTLHAVDTTAPQLNVYVDGNEDPTDAWTGPRGLPYTYTTAGDSGTSPVALAATFAGAAFSPVISTDPVAMDGPEDLDSPNSLLVPDVTGVVNDATYPLVVSATDGAGNASSRTVTFHADTQGPQGLTVDAPAAATTTARSFSPSGAIALSDRDNSYVYANLWRGPAAGSFSDCVDPTCGGKLVGFYDDNRGNGNVVNGRYSFNGGLVQYVGTEGSAPTPVGDLPDGTYTLTAGASDRFGNESQVTRTFTVATPTAAVAAPVVPATPAKPVVKPVTPTDLVTATLGKAVRSFAKETVASFVKDGANVPVTVTQAGTSEIQVFDRSAPKKVVASAAAAKKTKKVQKGLIASGKRTFAGPGAGTVKVRPTTAGKKTLKKHKKAVKVVIRSIFTPKGGKPVATDKKVRLKK